MRELEVGDRVVILIDLDNEHLAGSEGVIVDVGVENSLECDTDVYMVRLGINGTGAEVWLYRHQIETSEFIIDFESEDIK